MKTQSTLTGVSSHRSSASFRSAIALASAILASAAPIQAASVTWNAGGGADRNWINSGFTNWGGVDPSGNDLVLGSDGSTASPTTVTSVVNEDVSANSLLFQYNSTTNYQVLQIDNGATLSLGGAANVFTVGGYAQTSIATTKAVITGQGSLAIDQAGGTFSVNSVFLGNAATPSTAELDASGLKNLNVDLGSTGAVNIGVATTLSHGGTNYNSQGTTATLRLANESTITAGSLNIASNLAGTQVSLGNTFSTLTLGQENQLNIDTITVGKGVASSANGRIRFDSTVLGDASLRLRGADGTSAVTDIFLGNNMSGSSNTQTGIIDFSGGEIDVLVTNLTLGMGASASVGRATGTLTMDRGLFVATNVTAGYARNGAGAGINEGTINVAGGSFAADSIVLGDNSHKVGFSTGNLNVTGSGKVEVKGNLVMGDAVGVSGTSIYSGNVNVAGGSLTVKGNLGAVGNLANTSSTLSLRGGSLDLTGHTIQVSTFVAEAGSLRNVGSLLINGAATGLTKSGAGILRLSGSNTFAGGATVSGGLLLIDDGAFPTTGNVTVNTGGAVAFDTLDNLQSVISQKVASGATGSIALLNHQGAESLDFSASGANLTNAFLGAVGNVKYTGAFNPGGATYRLGGGTGNLDFASAITGAQNVIIGGGSGSVRLSGNNSYNGGTTVANGTLKLGNLSEIGSASSSLTLNAGTVEWISGSTADITSGRSVTLEAGGGTFSVAGGNAVTLTGGIAGTGGLTVRGGGSVVLQGLNTYSGATTVANGRLVADLSSHSTGVLNSSSSLTLAGGNFEVKGASSGVSSQTVGALTLTGSTANQLVIDRNGGTSTTLNVASLTRSAGSTLNVNLASGGATTAVLHATTAPTMTNSILAYATVTDAIGTGFATVDGSGNIVRNTTTTTLPVSPTAAINYHTSASTNRTLGAARTANSLTIDASAAGGVYNLNNFRLSLTSGGLLMTGANNYSITSGTLGADNAELIVHQMGGGTLFVSSVISGSAGSLTKAGSGALVLTGSSAYTGATSINEGTLQVDGALGNTAVSVNNAVLSGSGRIGGSVGLSGTSRLSSSSKLSVAGALNVNSLGNTLSSGTVSVVGQTTIASGASLTNNGALTGKGTLFVDGLLNGSGYTDKTVYTTTSGVISGNLTVDGSIGGSGSINPGNSPGLLTATEIDASQGLSFNFEFNSLDAINWSSLENDVLRLTSGDNPFAHALDSSNTVSLYLSASVIADLTEGGALIGGFYADSGDFVGSIENANYRAFYEDADGSILYNGVTYSEYSLAALSVSTVQNTHFSADGYITQFQFQVIPEPSTVALFGAGAIGLAMRVLRRKKG